MSLYKFPLQEINVCCTKAFLKMIFLFPRWDMFWQELERDRLEMAAELAHRGPTQSSKVRVVFRWRMLLWRNDGDDSIYVYIIIIRMYLFIYIFTIWRFGRLFNRCSTIDDFDGKLDYRWISENQSSSFGVAFADTADPRRKLNSPWNSNEVWWIRDKQN